MKRLAAYMSVGLLVGSLAQARAQDAAKNANVMAPWPNAASVPAMASAPTMASPPVCDTTPACDSSQQGGFYTGVGVEWLQPAFHNNPAFTTASASGGGTTLNLGQTDFHEHMEASPVAWIGFTSASGLGFQVDFWRFNESSFASANPAPGSILLSAGPLLGFGAIATTPGTTMATGSDLTFDVWDFDATYRTDFSHGWLLLGAGIRYAHFAEDYSAFTASAAAASNEALAASHSFNGGGPDLMAESHWRLGNSGFGLYGKARVALLFGTTEEEVDWKNILGLGGLPIIGTGANLHAQTSEFDTIPFLGIELGAEYARRIGQRAEVFVQSGLVAEDWIGAGNAANFDGLVLRSGSRSDLGLIGWSAQLGVRY